MDYQMLSITAIGLIAVAFFGSVILQALEPYECLTLSDEEESKPIEFPILPISESYNNIMQQIDNAETIQELNMALVDVYIFSGTYKDSDRLKNILLDMHLLKEYQLKKVI